MSQLDSQELGRLLEGKLPGNVRNVLRDARGNDNSVEWLIGSPSDDNFGNMIVPNPRVGHDVSFTDSEGKRLDELTVTRAANAFNVEYVDLGNSKRPGHEFGFVVSDDGPTSNHHLGDAFNLDRDQLNKSAGLWLADRSLIVVPCKIADGPDGSVLDTAFITTRNMAWSSLTWDIIHNAPTAERLQQDFNPQAFFLNVPGLRPTLFQGTQSTVFDRSDESCMVLSNSSYMGLGMCKKPIFVLVSRKLVEQGKGFLFHATMAELHGEKPNGQPIKMGFMYPARSGHGKTEFRFVRHGEVTIGKGRNGASDLTINYPRHLIPSRLVAAGDDGVIVRDFESGDGFAVGENMEKGGAFDRPSSAFELGDLPENDQMFHMAMGNPYQNLTLNLAAKAGKELFTHQRVMEPDGKGGWQPHSNPRQSYRWKDLAKTEALRSVNVDISTDPMQFQKTIYGMGTSKSCAVTSWAQLLPLCSAFTLNLAGICKQKSVSVTNDGNHNGNGSVGLLSDMFGTMDSFTINERYKNVNRYWEFFDSCNQLEHWATAIGYVGPNYVVNDNEAELLLRDQLYHLQTGNATWELKPGKIPFFGKRPTEANFLGNVIPPEYNDPYLQFTSKTEYKDAAHHLLSVVRNAVEQFTHDDRIHEGARKAIQKALDAPLFVDDPEEAERIFQHLSHV